MKIADGEVCLQNQATLDLWPHTCYDSSARTQVGRIYFLISWLMFTLVCLDTLSPLNLDPRVLSDIAHMADEVSEYAMRWIVQLWLVDDDMMSAFNEQYRGKTGTTDVLSFHYFNDFSGIRDDEIAWEVVMSLSRVSEQAGEMQHSKEAEFYRLLIHSLLHLVGYDHEEDQDHLVMLPKERTIINFLNEKYQLSIVI